MDVETNSNNQLQETNPSAESVREKRLKTLGAVTTKSNTKKKEEKTNITEVSGKANGEANKKRREQRENAQSRAAFKKTKTPPRAAKTKKSEKLSSTGMANTLKPHALIKRVFLVTLDANEEGQGEYFFLKDLSDSCDRLDVDMIDSVLYARLSASNPAINPLSYLVGCHVRLLAEESRLKKPSDKNTSVDANCKALVARLKTVIANFFNTTINNPEIFPTSDNNKNKDSELFSLLFHSAKLSESTKVLLREVLKGEGNQNTKEEDADRISILEPLFQEVRNRFVGKGVGGNQHQQQNPLALLLGNNGGSANTGTALILEPFSHAVNMLQQLTQLPHAPRILGQLSAFSSCNIFDRNTTGQQVEQNTLIGNILRIGTCGGLQSLGSIGGSIESAVARQYFSNPRHRTRIDVQQSSLTLRRQLETVVKCVHDLIKCMLIVKGEGADVAKQNLQKWIRRILVLSNGRVKDRPNPMIEIHDSLALNFNHVLLRLSEPFMRMKKVAAESDSFMSIWPRMKLVNLDYLNSREIGLLFGEDGKYEGIGGASISCQMVNQDLDDKIKYNFITRCFFFTVKSQHVGLIVGIQKSGLFERHMSHVYSQGNNAMFDSMLSLKFARDVQLCDPALLLKSLDFITFTAAWVYRCIIGISGEGDAQETGNSFASFPSPEKPNELCSRIPISMVEDIADVLTFIAQTDSAMLSSAVDKLDILLSFVTVVLQSGQTYFPSPHLRAKFGDLLLYAFVPPKSRGVFQNTGMGELQSFNEFGTANLLRTNVLALKALAPALLTLYGDVENTGFYDKTTHRLKISYVLKYLWSFKEHKNSIRNVAMLMDLDDGGGEKSSSQFSFIAFCNGILNQINSLISDSIGKLQSIKNIQDQMQDTEAWLTKSNEERQHINEKLKEDEQHVKSALMMSNETLEMLTYLTVEIKAPFSSSELLGRLASTLNSVLVKLAGRGGCN